MSMTGTILWVDDEIEQLKAPILFLEQRGMTVLQSTNGADALDIIGEQTIDVVFLDEQMPGMDGLTTLEKIKQIQPQLPVVMITKSEEESIMEDAIGRFISDYLIKPVNPAQLVITLKRILQVDEIQSEKTTQRYLQQFQSLGAKMDTASSWKDWSTLYQELVQWEFDLEGGESASKEILEEQYASANAGFSRYIEQTYTDWIATSFDQSSDDRPILSHEVLRTSLFPLLKERTKQPVCFVLIDCMRLDQWRVFEKALRKWFTIDTQLVGSILPTATPFSRNAIFSGYTPAQLQRAFPNEWDLSKGEQSLNQHEETFLKAALERNGFDVNLRYQKVVSSADGKKLIQSIPSMKDVDLTAVVYNFVDTLVHSRSDSDVLKELAPDARAFRNLTETWFEHSALLELFKGCAEQGIPVVVTTDHGSIRAMRDTKVFGDRDSADSLRYKYGRNLNIEEESHALKISKPEQYGLPGGVQMSSYLVAKEDYYFVYPTQYHKFQNKYRDTFQHGGISLEEMVLPLAVCRPS